MSLTFMGMQLVAFHSVTCQCEQSQSDDTIISMTKHLIPIKLVMIKLFFFLFTVRILRVTFFRDRVQIVGAVLQVGRPL